MGVACSVEEKVRRCVAKHPEWDEGRICNATGAPVGLIRSIRGKGRGKSAPGPLPTHAGSSPLSGISRTEFMAQHDPTTKMRNTLKAAVGMIVKGRFYRDHELRKLVGCGGGDPALWRALANDPDEGYAKYQFRMGDQVWWTDPASVAELVSTHVKAKAVT